MIVASCLTIRKCGSVTPHAGRPGLQHASGTLGEPAYGQDRVMAPKTECIADRQVDFGLRAPHSGSRRDRTQGPVFGNGWLAAGYPRGWPAHRKPTSRAPVAPIMWPVMDFVEETGMRRERSPNAPLIARVSD